MKKIFGIMIVMVLAIFMLTSCGVIDSGFTGVKIIDGVVQDETMPVGRYGALGANTTVVEVDNRRQTYTYNERIDGESEDKTVVWAQGVCITYSINADESVWVVKNIPDFKNHIIPDVKIASSVKNAMANISTEKVTNRSYIEPAAKQEIQSAVDTLYKPDVITIIDVSISSMDYEQSYNDAIAKISALRKQQEAEAIENQMKIDKAKAEADAETTKAEAAKKTAEANAEIALIEAQSYADTQKIKADADVNRLKQISNALTPEYLEYTKYQKWDGKLPTYTNGTTYFKVED